MRRTNFWSSFLAVVYIVIALDAIFTLNRWTAVLCAVFVLILAGKALWKLSEPRSGRIRTKKA